MSMRSINVLLDVAGSKEKAMGKGVGLLIGGQLVDGDASLDVVNPATNSLLATVPRASRTQAEAAIAAAKAAQPDWASRPQSDRARLLIAFADAIAAEAKDLAGTLVREQGKPLAEAEAEVSYAEIFVRHFAGMELPVEVIQDDSAYRIELHHKPLGVVVGITPWNFPVLIACYKLAPALLLGNTFVLKPAPTTPLTALMLARMAAPLFPPGVVNVLVDNNDLGELLTGHQDVAKVSFTGSTPTGRKVMAAAASNLKRLTLELGGNDAGIVLPDADIPKTAERVLASAFMNAGQVCIALKRLYVHSSIYEQMCAELARRADDMLVGDGMEQGVRIGPLQNRMQYEKAKRYLESARRDGRIIAGGELPDRPGFFMRPTIVCDIKDGAPLVNEEQFAPILPVIRYEDLDDVVNRANASEFGLGGSVWSRDEKRAVAVAQRIQSGTVWVNHATHFGPHIPFGGAKQSGLGVEFGREGLTEFAQRTVISVARA
jgi:acyl-CoA reductase-like NAD-dependent aldehyde dehydrogenase